MNYKEVKVGTERNMKLGSLHRRHSTNAMAKERNESGGQLMGYDLEFPLLHSKVLESESTTAKSKLVHLLHSP